MIKKILLYSIVIVIFIAVLFPIFWGFLNSFKPLNEIFTETPKIIGTTYTLENYQKIFEMTNFSRYLLNSVILTVSTSLIVILMIFLGAYAVVKYNFPGRSLYILFLLILQMIPIVVILTPLFEIVRFLRLYNTYRAVLMIQVGTSVPVCTWLMIGYIKEGCPKQIEEAARLDGCGILQLLYRVVIPLTMPGIVSVFIFVFLVNWGSLIIPLTFVGRDSMLTLPLAMANLMGQAGHHPPPWDLLMTMSVLYTLPVFIIALLLQRYISSGFLKGGLKF